MLFQGEEWAATSPFQYFANHEDPEMARAVSEGRKHEFEAFGWKPESIPDPENRETFVRSKLNWSEVSQGEHAEMLAWHRNLIRVRRATACLNDGEPGRTRVTYNQQETMAPHGSRLHSRDLQSESIRNVPFRSLRPVN